MSTILIVFCPASPEHEARCGYKLCPLKLFNESQARVLCGQLWIDKNMSASSKSGSRQLRQASRTRLLRSAIMNESLRSLSKQARIRLQSLRKESADSTTN